MRGGRLVGFGFAGVNGGGHYWIVQNVPAGDAAVSEIELTWPLPPQGRQSAVHEVHVWSAVLLRPEMDYVEALDTLSESERERSRRFHFERDRKSFIARRALLRSVLARYLNIAPAEIRLAFEERGKPTLFPPGGAQRLHFNFTHSRNLALCAVCEHSPVGVDVEKIRPMPELSEIAATFCSPEERASIHSSHGEKKLDAFFSVWTRKECYLKGTGEGIAGSLAQIDCMTSPPPWTIHALSPAPRYVGAVAVTGADARLCCWRWPVGEQRNSPVAIEMAHR